MAEVKWIKITTNMFDNRKIRQIRHLPEGNNIVLIWVMLLTIAGRCNANGMIFLTEDIPYTVEMLALELDFEQSVITMALKALKQFGMIVYDDADFYITNWEEYQNIDGLEKIREQNRIRQKRWYDKQKELPNVIPNASLTEHNATDKEIEEDKDIKNKNKKIYEEFACGNSALLDALKEFDSFRKKVKKPLTDKAKERLVKRLQTFPKEDWIEILHKSIDRGWTDVYPLDSKQPAKQVDRSFTPTVF